MKVGLVNQIGFRAAGTQTGNADAPKNLGLKDVLTNDCTWSKTYNPEKDEVDINSIVATDMGSYTIKNDGTVISRPGYTPVKQEPEVVLEKNQNLADYVKNQKEKKEILEKIAEDVSFTSNETKTDEAAEAEASIEAKKPKSARNSVANFWKFMTTANQMANSALKGLFYGALTGVALLGGSWIFKALPKAFTKEGPTLWNTIRHPLKNIGKSGKVIAGIGSAAVLGYQLVAGRLAANEKTAVIDHKLKIGHRDK